MMDNHMTVDPERLKVAMEAAREAYNENSDLDCNLTALNYALRAYDAALDRAETALRELGEWVE